MVCSVVVVGECSSELLRVRLVYLHGFRRCPVKWCRASWLCCAAWVQLVWFCVGAFPGFGIRWVAGVSLLVALGTVLSWVAVIGWLGVSPKFVWRVCCFTEVIGVLVARSWFVGCVGFIAWWSSRSCGFNCESLAGVGGLFRISFTIFVSSKHL